MKKYLAIFGLILVTVIWGGGFVASDMALESLTPFQIMTFRFFLGTVILGGISLPGMKDIKKEEIRAGFFMGCALFAGFALQIVGLQYTTPSKNAFLTATNVVMVPFIAFLVYKKTVGMNGIVGAVMAIVGVGILSLNGNLSLGAGDALTLVGFKYSTDGNGISSVCRISGGAGRIFCTCYFHRLAQCVILGGSEYRAYVPSSDKLSEVCG